MTPTTSTVFHHYQVRKTKKQKARFREYIQTVARQHGYCHAVEKGMFGSRNIVIGNSKEARVIYTAHYDTCAVLPFPNLITPKNPGLFVLYQLAIACILLVILFFLTALLGTVCTLAGIDTIWVLIGMYLLCFGLLTLLLFGPANQHTANDNTSGVTVLLDIMTALPEEARAAVSFVFFDREEMGLLGSSSFYSRHKSEMKHKLLVNFDCVSDGNTFLFAVRKQAQPFIPMLTEAFEGNETFGVQVMSKGVIYPSDQMNFPCGVGVAALKNGKRFPVAYLDRIHTKRDTVYQEENIAFLTAGALRLADRLGNLKTD